MDIGVIAAVLRGSSAVQWQITETRLARHERYLTFLRCESEREVSARRWAVWLALPPEGDRQGESTFSLDAGDGPSDLRERLDEALAAARVAPSPAWNLPEPGGDGVASSSPQDSLATGAVSGQGATTARLAAAGGLCDQSVISDAPGVLGRLVATAERVVQTAPWVRPSTLELFATVSDRRLLNHNGLDLHERRTRLYAEFVLLHRPEGGDEVEFFDRAEASSARNLALDRRLAEAAETVRALPGAGDPPTGVLPVLIGGEYLPALLSWFTDHAEASRHVRRIAALEIGKPVVTRSGGDPLVLASDARVPSLAAYRFDDHGYASTHQELVTAGVLTGLHGSGRWMQVLGRPPRGQCGTLVAPAGSATLETLRRGALEVVRFSDFHPRSDTGAFSGEIRFAWWHRPDGSRVAVRGGSVSGTLRQALADVRFSEGLHTLGGYHGPLAARFFATVAC